MSSKRLFFALWPDHRQRDRLRDFITPVAKEVEGRMIDRRNWHVTLAYIGEFPERRVSELQDVVQRVTVEPFRLRFDPLEFWARPKIAALVAPTVPNELEELVETLKGDATKAKQTLGWSCKVTFRELVEEMVETDLKLFGKR